jgi:hypothetical protein
LNYYSGGGAIPTWTTDEKLAAPVDLDATTAGIQTNEPHDIINQTSVVWSATLGRWVMFYGGGSTNLPTVSHPGCGVVEFFQGADCTTVDMGNGAFRMRLAVHPWGPWSPPQDIIAATDPDVTPLSVHYKKGGMLRHPDCATAGGVGVCAPHTNSAQFNNADEYGFWYGASIVAPWLKDATGGGVNVTWLASTWDPYRVVMLKTKVML